MYSAADARILRRHVSNLDENVYLIFNLPEEVIAVIFAFVSRSPLSFRDNLLKLIRDAELALVDSEGEAPEVDYSFATEKAKQFHEKWVVGYGHASVAEHAMVHVGVEKISRLASAELELSNPFLSFTEYSQRYQKPARGAFYVPPELDGCPELKARFIAVNHFTYDVYERLEAGLLPFLRQTVARRETESEKAYETRISKLAFEDARYALTLAVHTNLGLSGNARAVRDGLVRLFSDPYPETKQLAAAIVREVKKHIPTLLKYAEASPYLVETQRAFAAMPKGWVEEPPRAVRLLDYTGKGQPDPAEHALDQVVGALLFAHGLGPERLVHMTRAEKAALFQEAVRRMTPHDHPLDALKLVQYQAELCISEANWHQFLRHSRVINFVYQPPGIGGGIAVPPNVEKAGLGAVLGEAVEQVESVHEALRAQVPLAAPYMVTGAHRRRVRAGFHLWELCHLVGLRGTKSTQWDIRQTVHDLARAVREVHPELVEAPPIQRFELWERVPHVGSD